MSGEGLRNRSKPKLHYRDGILVQEGAWNGLTMDQVPFAVTATPEDLDQAADAYSNAYYQDQQAPAFVVPPPTIHAMDTMKRENTLDGVSKLFARYEVPAGLLSRLLELKAYDLVFILDDSGSMGTPTDLYPPDFTSEFMVTKHQGRPRKTISRWEEQEDRLHMVMEFLSWIPTGQITVKFLNRPEQMIKWKREHAFSCQEEFLQSVRRFIDHQFAIQPTGNTPIFKALSAAMQQPQPTMIYLFTDGTPTDTTPDNLKSVICYRTAAADHPITLVSCTSDDSEVEWMKDVDEQARWVAEVDDYKTEKKEVQDKQGKYFPYSKGMWIMCLLVAAINPADLDALDEWTPLSQEAFGSLMGRYITKEEYQLYLKRKPKKTDGCIVS